MNTSPFVHLHVHTEYSLLDGAARLDKLVGQAKELGMTALAMTDHGVMYGAVEFYQTCNRYGIKPIIGCEVYLAFRSRHQKEAKIDDDPYHLVLLAENETGYRNLVKLVSLGHLEGFYYKPRVDMDLLATCSEGLIALSGCLAGQIPQLIMNNNLGEAESVAKACIDIFGQNSFFLELQDHGLEEQQVVNKALVELARRTGAGLVATNDVHFVEQRDAEAHDVLLCIQTAKKVDDTDRMRLPSDMFYLRTGEEMADLFSWCPEAVDNTKVVAERCEVTFDLNNMLLPRFPLPDYENAADFLRSKCEELLPKKFDLIDDSIRQRLDYELDVITKMGFADYFLIVWDFVNYAKSQSIPVGPGRGSVTGSLTAYVLGITNVNPLQYGLIFERFLNPERVTMPDMDIDFCYERRNEVIEYVVEKYGKDSVAQIITFGTMAARAAIRDVGRALNLSYAKVDKIAKMVPAQIGMTLERALELASDLSSAVEEDPETAKLLELARAVEGLARHASVHAAGVVIADRPLMDYVPLQRTTDGGVVTQYTMEILEKLGLLKMDFLALRTLTVLDDCVRRLRDDCGVDIDLDNLPLDDEITYQMLSRGESQGVFQLESDWVREILKDLKPERFEDMIASVALCRPGPMEHIPEYVQNKRNGPTYIHPDLEAVLAETYGIMIYQEQVVQTASHLAGFTMGQGDILRWAMGKKKPDLIESMREAFFEGTAARGIDNETATRIFDLIDRFSGYGFNKCHATAYGLIAYQTAYLKANYPREFMASLLTSVMGSSDKVAQYINYCQRLGIDVLPPDVNVSTAKFTVADEDIRFGLSAVKNVGQGAIEAILKARESGKFKSLRDFCSRVDMKHLNRRAVESLIKAGAFDAFADRGSLLASAEQILESTAALNRQLARGQLALFGTEADEVVEASSEERELPRSRLLAMEKEVLGLYISGHPLGERKHELEVWANCQLAGLSEYSEGAEVRAAGLVTNIKKISTRSGQMMAFVTVSDVSGTAEVIVFPPLFEDCGSWLDEDEVVLIRGKLSSQDEDLKIAADQLTRATEGSRVVVNLDNGPDLRNVLFRLQELLRSQHGNCPVYVEIQGEDNTLLVGRDCWVRVTPNLMSSLQRLLGRSRVREG